MADTDHPFESTLLGVLADNPERYYSLNELRIILQDRGKSFPEEMIFNYLRDQAKLGKIEQTTRNHFRFVKNQQITSDKPSNTVETIKKTEEKASLHYAPHILEILKKSGKHF